MSDAGMILCPFFYLFEWSADTAEGVQGDPLPR